MVHQTPSSVIPEMTRYKYWPLSATGDPLPSFLIQNSSSTTTTLRVLPHTPNTYQIAKAPRDPHPLSIRRPQTPHKPSRTIANMCQDKFNTLTCPKCWIGYNVARARIRTCRDVQEGRACQKQSLHLGKRWGAVSQLQGPEGTGADSQVSGGSDSIVRPDWEIRVWRSCDAGMRKLVGD
jgi:hypothetical protein